MIDNAVEVRMATALETGRWPRLVPMDADCEAPPMPKGPSTGYGQGVSLSAPCNAVSPARPGVIAELGELRASMYNRHEDFDNQHVSARARLSALESHVFGDGPNAVSGR
jgi:hypothetical protein